MFQGLGYLLHRGHSYMPGTVQVWRKYSWRIPVACPATVTGMATAGGKPMCVMAKYTPHMHAHTHTHTVNSLFVKPVVFLEA